MSHMVNGRCLAALLVLATTTSLPASQVTLDVSMAHPLLRAVSLDRTFYAPIPVEAYADYAERVPDDFRFLVKAPEHVTLSSFPQHARYGASRMTR